MGLTDLPGQEFLYRLVLLHPVDDGLQVIEIILESSRVGRDDLVYLDNLVILLSVDVVLVRILPSVIISRLDRF